MLKIILGYRVQVIEGGLSLYTDKCEMYVCVCLCANLGVYISILRSK
jgi:hypothetical protein